MTHDLSTASVSSITDAAESSIQEAEAFVESAVQSAGSSFADRIAPLDEALGVIQDAHGYGPFLANFHTDGAVRDAGHAAEQRLSTWSTDVIARRDVYNAVLAVDADTLGGLERRSHDEWIRDLRRAGHELPESDRIQVQELRQRIIELQVKFARNLADHKDHLDVRVEDLAGLPDSYVESLSPGAEDGTVSVTLDYPDYVPFMEQAPVREQRRQLRHKYQNKAVVSNRPLLEETIRLRSEIANILGYDDWAAYSMEVKMADPVKVGELYDSIIPGLTTLGRREVSALTELLHEDHPDANLEQWDRPYYHTIQQRRDFGIDQNTVAEYFPLDQVIAGMLDVTGEVLGLTYTAIDDLPMWHDDVRSYRINDAATGAEVAVFHLDLHPREGKYTHAACWSVINRKRRRDGSVRVPVAAVAANFTKPTEDAPSLLKHDEAVTLWHEFGHVLHACLTTVEMQRFAGYESEWDFVEAPSQIMENWMWTGEVLRRFARHHKTGDPIPDELVDGLLAARDQNVGLLTLRQVFLGQFDLMMHTSGPDPDLDHLERTATEFTLLPHQSDTFMAAGFGHLMGGYDAGYYGYLWSQVYGDDMFSVFEDEGILSQDVGSRYRNEVLAMGSSRDAWDHLQAFLGRSPNADAFLHKLGI